MTHHLFFSWQSDVSNGIGRGFIQSCLERAISTLRADADIDPADREVAVDRDTLGVPGSPPIMETIFGKIDRAAIFVSDLTYVAERTGGRRTPNPNVCIEHGYALKSLSWRRVVAVMNIAMGDPDQHELPFDVRHTRRPILFDCAEDASPEARRQARDVLTKQLVAALKAVFGDEAARATMGDAMQAEADGRQAATEAALNELAFDAHRGGVPEIVTRPRLILRLASFAAAEGRRLDSRQVGEMQLRFPPSVDERAKSDSDGRQWWSCAPPRRRQANLNPETTWLMRLVRPGYLEFQTNIGQRIDDDPEILVDGRSLEAKIVRTLERMAIIVLGLNLGGPALVSVTLDGVEDVELTRARPGGKRIRQPEIVLPTATVADLSKPLARSLHEQFDILWQTSGWADGSPSFGSGEWAG
jgi:hypothetical protein